MAEEKFNLQNFAKPPEKVRLMFQAVTELLFEKTDMNAIKVADITKRAGIGKGTAYEYFSSKEEIITMALLYDYKVRLEQLEERLDKQKSFQEKMYCILDWIDANSSYHVTFMHMIQLSSGDANLCETLKAKIPEEILNGMHDYVFEQGNLMMEQGYEEKLYTETDPVKRRMAFAGMILEFFLTLSPKSRNAFFQMDVESAKQYVYESMMKQLKS